MEAFFAVLLSYEYSTETLRVHMNMKEPGNTAEFMETDTQWNFEFNMPTASPDLINLDKQ